MNANETYEKAAELGVRLEAAIAAKAGVLVRATVGDQIMLRSENETDLDRAVAFMSERPEFVLHRRFEARGAYRATFRIAK